MALYVIIINNFVDNIPVNCTVFLQKVTRFYDSRIPDHPLYFGVVL